MAAARADGLEQKGDIQRVASGLAAAQAAQQTDELGRTLRQRDATIASLTAKVQTLEAEVSELQVSRVRHGPPSCFHSNCV
eukprot:SAG22_NODE_949_length_6356_cov_2.100527_7_plen_81_part_00